MSNNNPKNLIIVKRNGRLFDLRIEGATAIVIVGLIALAFMVDVMLKDL